MAKVIMKDYLESGDIKCGCGYWASRLYYLEGWDPNEEAMCCSCFAEHLEECGYQVFQKSQKFEILINKLLKG